MRLIIKLILIAGMLTLHLACVSEKILEKSSEQRPYWVYGIEKDRIIRSGLGNTIEDAKIQAMMNVRNEILKSVSLELETDNSWIIRELINNGRVSDLQEEYLKYYNEQSKFFRSLSGLSFNRVKAFYWEKKRVDKKVVCEYHINFHFTSREMETLIEEYNQTIEWLRMRMTDIENQLTDFSELDPILSYLDELNFMTKILPEQQQARLQALIERIHSIIRNISINISSNKIGLVEFSLVYGSKIVGINSNPGLACNFVRKYRLNRENKDFQFIFDASPTNINVKERPELRIFWNVKGYQIERNVELKINRKEFKSKCERSIEWKPHYTKKDILLFSYSKLAGMTAEISIIEKNNIGGKIETYKLHINYIYDSVFQGMQNRTLLEKTYILSDPLRYTGGGVSILHLPLSDEAFRIIAEHFKSKKLQFYLSLYGEDDFGNGVSIE
jgi:hypothetical protein